MLSLILALLAYFALHSMFASLRIKHWVAAVFPAIMPWYRLLFNAIAVLTLLPILYVLNQTASDYLWQWQGTSRAVMYACAGLSIIGFVHSLKFYDMSEFFGFRQIQEHFSKVEELEHLTISPYHRFVRHPWYFFAIIIIWARDINQATLVFNSLITLYFILGSKLEERKLLSYYGQSYQTYQQKVPAIFPLPWRFLSQHQAQQLEQQSRFSNK